MRIINRAAFLLEPPGTVFQKYEPCVFGPICIKEDTCGSDFVVQDPDPYFGGHDGGDEVSTLFRIEAGEPSPPMDFDFAGRDGLFDDDQLFAVWSDDDVKALIARLAMTLLPSPSGASPP